MVLYFEACLGHIVPAWSEKYRGILPPVSEWPHVLKLCLFPLQALAQALDVFIALALLLVHFQQRPQDFDATPFIHHTLSVSKLAYNSAVSGCFHRFIAFIFQCGLNVVLGAGRVAWPSVTSRHLTTHSQPPIYRRLLYADMAHVKNDV
jgi:hypothetical protein